MKITKGNEPKLQLTNLLRRRKMTLLQFVNEFGINTYAALQEQCVRFGVTPPDEKTFLDLGVQIANDPMNGIIVVETQVNNDVVVIADPAAEESLVFVDDNEKKKKPRKQKIDKAN